MTGAETRVLNADVATHLLRLGYISEVGGSPAVTLDDRRGAEKRGFRLSDADAAFLESLDPDEGFRRFTAEERERLRVFFEERLVTILDPRLSHLALNVIPVQRREMRVTEVLEDGYRMAVDGGQSVDLEEYAARFILSMDGHRTLAQIVDIVDEQARAEASDEAAVVAWEQQAGQPFRGYLAQSAVHFAATMLQSGAVTFEPGVSS